MKRLFVVKHNGVPVKDVFFHKKEEAKTYRDECIHQGWKNVTVGRGPDHWKGL